MDRSTPSSIVRAAEVYGLHIVSCRRLRRVWRLETDRGVFALKQALPEPDDSWLFEAERHLARHGFDRFSPRISTPAGNNVCALPTGERFVLRRWLPGTFPGLDLEHPRDLSRTAEAVAGMHLAARDFYGAEGVRRAWGSWPAVLDARLADLRRYALETERAGRFARQYRRIIPLALAEGEKARELTEASGYGDLADEAARRGGLCHGDLAPNNLLIHGDRAYLLDLDRAEHDVAPFDLAVLIRRAMAAQGWPPVLGGALLQAYESVRPLSAIELRVMVAFLHWPQDLWRLGHQYFTERLERSERFFLDRLWHWRNLASQRRAFLDLWRKKCWRE